MFENFLDKMLGRNKKDNGHHVCNYLNSQEKMREGRGKGRKLEGKGGKAKGRNTHGCEKGLPGREDR